MVTRGGDDEDASSDGDGPPTVSFASLNLFSALASRSIPPLLPQNIQHPKMLLSSSHMGNGVR